MKHLILLVATVVSSPSLVRAQAINIDLGHSNVPRPTNGYRGVGLPGAWNKFDALDTSAHYPLVGLDGVVTAATAHQVGGTEIVSSSLGGPNDPKGNDAVLLGDALVTHTPTENCLFFDGLLPGTYEVVTYAWMPTAPRTPNLVRVDNNPISTTVGGPWLGSQTENVTYARHFVDVTSSGTMGLHSGVPSGGNYTTGAAMNGVQIRRLEVAPPLFADRTQLQWLSSLGATRYDVQRGSLDTLLATRGNFALATEECLANDIADTRQAYPSAPAAGHGFWFLVRGVGAGGPLTWDEPGGSQVRSRDVGIASSPNRCP